MNPGAIKEKKYRQIEGVGFISTIYNEEKSLPSFLKSFFEQGCLPEEMVFVDGGSSDGTLDVLKKFFADKIVNEFGIEAKEKKDKPFIEEPISGVEICGSYDLGFYPEGSRIRCSVSVLILCKKNASISEGRNIAIKNSGSGIICGSDAGCFLDKNWIYKITGPLMDGKKISGSQQGDKNIEVAGGYSKPVAISFMEKVLSMCIMPQLKEVRAESFMPSSRNIAFSKIAWAKAGGYPEYMDYGEDMKFNFNLKDAGYKIIFVPEAIVYWRMREDPVKIFKQFFRYAKGDALGGMYLHRHIIRFSSLFDFAVIVSLSIIFSPWILLILMPFFAFYVFKPFSRLNSTFCHQKNRADRFFIKVAAIFTAPLMLVYIDTAKVFGFIYGFFKK